MSISIERERCLVRGCTGSGREGQREGEEGEGEKERDSTETNGKIPIHVPLITSKSFGRCSTDLTSTVGSSV